ncbi:Serine incorporator/TMS membrane protein, partial [Trinorchestia longiramus]
SMLQLAMCCGSAACSLCCSVCPSCKNSSSSRIMYALLLLLSTIVACIMLSPGLQSTLAKAR